MLGRGRVKSRAVRCLTYAFALTETMLCDPRSCQLPRKYKITFSGCEQDSAGAMVNDVGLIAQVREGRRASPCTSAGGWAAMSRTAELLEAFVPAHEVHLVAEAVKRIFDKHGNRENRHKAQAAVPAPATGNAMVPGTIRRGDGLAAALVVSR